MQAPTLDSPDETLETRAARVANLLKLSGESGIILFLTYAYEATRQRVQTIYTAQLAESNLHPVYLDLRNDKTIGDDLTYVILDHRKSPQDVIVVIGLGEPELRERRLRSLNYRRELLVDGKVKVIFWLTDEEVREIAMQAPDFWAFKHRIIDFPEAAQDGAVRQVFQSATAFIGQTRFEDAAELRHMIATREAILAALPKGSAAQRLDLLESLWNLYYDTGEWGKSQATARSALTLARRRKDEPAEARMLHGLGMLAQGQGRLEEALSLYQKAKDAYERLGNQRGIASTLHQLGTLDEGAGRLKEAQEQFAQALAILERLGSPDAAIARQSLQRVQEKLKQQQSTDS